MHCMNKFIYKSNTKLQGLALAVILLFSIGQSLAFYKSCEMDKSNHANHTSQMSEHQSMVKDSSQTLQSEDLLTMGHKVDNDCCQSSCLCPQGACSSANLISLSYERLFTNNPAQSELEFQNTPSSDNFLSSLYRPPITC